MRRSKGGNGYWNREKYPTFPVNGWELIEIDDHGEQDHLCQMCHAKWVRYVHTVRHDAWDDDLDVGCECSSKLTGDHELCNRGEKAVKAQADRRKTFIDSPLWKVSAKGNSHREYKDKHVTIVEYESRCAVWLDGKRTFHDNLSAAKLAAFGMIDGDHGFTARELALLKNETPGALPSVPDQPSESIVSHVSGKGAKRGH